MAEPENRSSLNSTLSSDKEVIGAAIGRIPSGCAILTASHEWRRSGVLISWFQQASFEPPSVSVALRRGRPIIELVDSSQRFLLNIIGVPSTPMFRHFGRGFNLDDDAFQGLAMEMTPFGPLLESCIAHLACQVSQKIHVGDHDLYIARVERASSRDSDPYVHIRNSGLTY